MGYILLKGPQEGKKNVILKSSSANTIRSKGIRSKDLWFNAVFQTYQNHPCTQPDKVAHPFQQCQSPNNKSLPLGSASRPLQPTWPSIIDDIISGVERLTKGDCHEFQLPDMHSELQNTHNYRIGLLTQVQICFQCPKCQLPSLGSCFIRPCESLDTTGKDHLRCLLSGRREMCPLITPWPTLRDSHPDF